MPTCKCTFIEYLKKKYTRFWRYRNEFQECMYLLQTMYLYTLMHILKHHIIRRIFNVNAVHLK